MNELFDWLQKYATLFDLTLLMVIFGYILKINSSISEKKDATIEALREQSKIKEEFAVEKVAERFRSLKEIYEVHLSEWYKKSIEDLDLEKQKAIQENRVEMESQVSEEIKKRSEIKEKYETLLKEKQVIDASSKDYKFAGTYSVSGRSPYFLYGTRDVFTKYSTYFGELEITEDAQTYKLEWKINSNQNTATQIGTGVQIGNVLSAIFCTADKTTEDNWYGVVSYEVINNEILRGTWAVVDKNFVGQEELRKVNEKVGG